MNLGRKMLVAALACLGFGGSQAPAIISSTPEARAIIQNGKTTKAIEADMFGRYSGGIGAGFMRGSHTPYDWGISRQCAQMRRKNRMRSLGIKGSRI
jgi:hypothetical protein